MDIDNSTNANLALELEKLKSENALLKEEITWLKLSGRQSEMITDPKFKHLVENAQDIIYEANADGNFTYVNTLGLNTIGYEKQEVIGKNYLSLIPEYFHAEITAFYRNCLNDKKSTSYFEFPISHKKSGIIWLGQHVQFIWDGDELVKIQSVARDITEKKQTETELVNANTRLLALISSLQSGVLVEDQTRKIVLTNQNFCQIFGIPVSPELLVGMDCSKSAEESSYLFTNPDQFVNRIEQVLKDRKLVSNEEVVMKDGRNFSRDYIPIWFEQNYLGHLWQYRDITAQKNADEQLKLSEEKYRSIIENMELGLLEVDNDGMIVRAFDKFCELFGYQAEELKGKDPRKLFLFDDQSSKLVEEQANKRKEKQAGVYELRMKTKSGEPLWILISGASIVNRQGEVTGSLGIHFDITQRKKLEQELKEAQQLAEESRKSEQSFLANMSHELRTPLNALIGMAHLLYDTNPSPEQMDYLDSIKHSGSILLDLINDILDISKIEAGKLIYQEKEFDLHSLLTTLQKTYQLKTAQREIAVNLSIDSNLNTLIKGDYLLLNQILLNLLGNAEKFTEHGEIQIIANVISKSESYYDIEFEIKDTGVGIDHTRLKTIFNKYEQADLESKLRFGGTGLGLTICNKIVEFLHGEIFVVSTKGKGSSFFVKLKFGNTGKKLGQQPIDLQTEVNFKTDSQINRILVAEDNLLNRNYLKGILDKLEVEYCFATNGREAIDMAMIQPFDLILMDLQMPLLSGLEATIKLRNSPGVNQNCPIIALTASALKDEKAKSEIAGMNDFLSKPFSPDQLIDMINRFGKINVKIKEKPNAIKTHLIPHEEDFHPALDGKFLRDFYEGDNKYYQMMVRMFLESIENDLTLLDKNVEKKDWKGIYEIAHKMRPTFPMVGLTDLERIIENIEIAAYNKVESDVVQNNLLLQSKTHDFIPILRNELNRLNQ